jgi:DNA-directed RNA polymerase I subunit RPA43
MLITYTERQGRLTVANEMLSLLGSIQPDPFSPKHVPVHVASAKTSREPSLERQDEIDEDNDDSDIDTFQRLATLGNAMVSEEKRNVDRLKKSKKEKKRKRKGEIGHKSKQKET